MQDYQRRFIDFMVRSEVLTFGDFTTKSGRKTPFFVNTGRYRTGGQLNRLSAFYAEAIQERFGDGFDVLFGPAYKGIPLVVGIAMELERTYGRDVAYAFNRKEAKDHGEGGVLVGHALGDGERVLIVEDVTTAGTSIRETVPILRSAADVELAGLIVSVDRMERGQGEKNALDELAEEFAFATGAIVTIEDVIDHLEGRAVDGSVVLTAELADRMRDYRRTWGGATAVAGSQRGPSRD